MQQQLGEANTALRAKEDKCNKVAQERDRLAKELKDQAELHKTALKQTADNEAGLLAEFETEHSDWAETKAALTAGYVEIEDIFDGELPSLLSTAGYRASRLLASDSLFVCAYFFPGNSLVANQAIEARCEE